MQDNEGRARTAQGDLRSALMDRMQDDVSTYGKILEILSRVDRERYLLECEVTALAHQLRVKSEELRVVRGQLRELQASQPPESGLWNRLTS
jgi:hypothetical protein